MAIPFNEESSTRLERRHWWLLHQGTAAWARRLWHGVPGAGHFHAIFLGDFPIHEDLWSKFSGGSQEPWCFFFAKLSRCVRTLWLAEDFPWHGLTVFGMPTRPPQPSGPSKHSPRWKRGRDTPWNAWSCPYATPRLKWSQRVTGHWAGDIRGIGPKRYQYYQ